MSERPLVHLFLGVPGSGKSYFARHLAERTRVVRIGSDAIRLAIFGSRESMNTIYHSPQRQQLNTYVDGAMHYITSELLERGQSIIADAHHNKRSDREAFEAIAAGYNARVVLIWVKTPFDIALTRGQTREATADQRQLSAKDMREVMERHEAAMDKPQPGENIIIVNGEQPFEQQYESYQTQLANLFA